MLRKMRQLLPTRNTTRPRTTVVQPHGLPQPRAKQPPSIATHAVHAATPPLAQAFRLPRSLPMPRAGPTQCFGSARSFSRNPRPNAHDATTASRAPRTRQLIIYSTPMASSTAHRPTDAATRIKPIHQLNAFSRPSGTTNISPRSRRTSKPFNITSKNQCSTSTPWAHSIHGKHPHASNAHSRRSPTTPLKFGASAARCSTPTPTETLDPSRWSTVGPTSPHLDILAIRFTDPTSTEPKSWSLTIDPY